MTSFSRRYPGVSPRLWLLNACACASLLGGGLAGVVLIVLSGCAHAVTGPRPVAPPAIIVVENHTDYVWRVAFDPVAPGAHPAANPVSWEQLAPRETRRVELPGGVYRIGRALGAVKPGSPEPAIEKIELTFEGGKIYSWPLGTLLSNERAPP